MGEHKLEQVIHADLFDFVRYSRLGKEYTVTKGLCTELSDAEELYAREIRFQEMLAKLDFAPKILKKGIRAKKDGMKYVMWVSADAGLPIEDADIPEANKLLDHIYNLQIVYHWSPHKSHFVKGFDGKIRVTDFKQTELLGSAIPKEVRRYV